MTHNIVGDHFATQDKLDFEDYLSVLESIVLSADSPLTIGIFGSWGTGKTSLMRMLKEQIVHASPWKVRVVWFNAWKFDREESLWRAFILRVIDSIRPRGGKGELLPEEQMTKAQNNMSKDLDRLEESLYKSVEWQEFSKWTLDWSKAITSTAKGAAELAFLFIPGAAPFIETLVKAREILAEGKSFDELNEIAGAFQRQVKEYRREHLRSLEQFEYEFTRIVNQYIFANGGRLIVFVDDLDRCLPEKSLDVLEAIKLFLEVPGCIFIVGVDREIIEKGIALRYANSNLQQNNPSIISGEKYLQKMIQLPFHLPELSLPSIRKYINDIDDELSISEQMPLNCREILALGSSPNPRQIKRTINLFRMLKGVAERRERRGQLPYTIALPLLAKTVLIQSYFPKLYTAWTHFPTLVQQLENNYRFGAQMPLETKTEADLTKETAAPKTGTSSVLEKYSLDDELNIRLEKIISYGTIKDHETPKERELFGSLSRAEVMIYIHLARTGTDQEIALERSETELWSDLISNDPIRVHDCTQEIQEAGQMTKNSYLGKLLQAIRIQEGLPITQRVSAGMALSFLGDPRDLTDMSNIKAGDFISGDKLEKKTLSYNFSIGKYLVTNKEFRNFVDAKGYENKLYWSDKGWEWRNRKDIYHPACWHDARFNLPNYPVVGTSLYEAEAYSKYMSMRLPTEGEWERTARGQDGKNYPWGNEYIQGYANTSDVGINGTCAVGLFSSGTSINGVYDLAGQVWEWTVTQESDGRYILKGGTWGAGAIYARSDYRFGLNGEVRDAYVGFRLVKDDQQAQEKFR